MNYLPCDLSYQFLMIMLDDMIFMIQVSHFARYNYAYNIFLKWQTPQCLLNRMP